MDAFIYLIHKKINTQMLQLQTGVMIVLWLFWDWYLDWL